MSGNGVQYTRFPDGTSFRTLYPYSITSQQITTSEENLMWILKKQWERNRFYRDLPPRIKNLLKRRDTGSPFTTERRHHWTSHPHVEINDGDWGYGSRTYTGPIFARANVVSPTSSLWPTLSAVSESSLISKGASFISQTIPTNPVGGLMTVLGELREQLPQIPGQALLRSHLRDYRQGGGEYLNIQFGILPLYNDIKKIVETANEADKLIAQYTRDSGRLVRRRAKLQIETSTEVTTPAVSGFISPAIPLPFYSSTSGVMTRRRVTTLRWSFSGAYTYYLDPGVTYLGQMKRNEQIAAKLYGTRLTPEVLWELTPWSWAIDWQTNFGDVMTNISALLNDSLVIRWAYVMCHQTITDTYTLSGTDLKGVKGPFSQSFAVSRKVRRKATPYGFGLDPAAFTASQWAIIGALGISKGPRQL
nr:MAG: maturation protein [Leviviridae sp.]